MDSAPVRTPFPVRRIRALVLVALVAAISVFTGTMLRSVDRLSKRFGPEVRADLEWRAQRGAAELARVADLGVAMQDAPLIQEAFSAQTRSSDIVAIAALNGEGALITEYGEVDVRPVVAAKPHTIVGLHGDLASWAPVRIEGVTVGKIVTVVSTHRLSETHAILGSVSRTSLLAGLLVVVFGAGVLFYVTRALATRDAQLGDYAANLEAKVTVRTQELHERNEAMRFVLDNVIRGFITIDPAGVMASERSAVFDTWFGVPARGITLVEFMRASAPEFATWLQLGMEMLGEGIMPLEVCLAQLPKRFVTNGQTFDVSYAPIMAGDVLVRILVIIADVTSQLAGERAARDQHELVTVFQRISADRSAGEEFLTEGAALVQQLGTPTDKATEDRALHTLKGNCGLFGFERFAELCHNLESELADSAAERLSEDQRDRIIDGWWPVTQTLTSLLGVAARDAIEVTHAELAGMIERCRMSTPGEELAMALTEWSHEPVARRFERLGQQAAGLARRLGKGEIEITIADAGIRLDPVHWSPIWAALSHAVRNAVDHGFESAAERQAMSKGVAKLVFAAARTDRHLLLSISDDGRGIDWEGLRARAAEAGLVCTTRHELSAAMFADGMSTRTEVTEVSGRGIGLAALRAAVVELGGTVDVDSVPGKGTRFEMRFPCHERRDEGLESLTEHLDRRMG